MANHPDCSFDLHLTTFHLKETDYTRWIVGKLTESRIEQDINLSPLFNVFPGETFFFLFHNFLLSFFIELN